jgi:hypothetical protein
MLSSIGLDWIVVFGNKRKRLVVFFDNREIDVGYKSITRLLKIFGLLHSNNFRLWTRTSITRLLKIVGLLHKVHYSTVATIFVCGGMAQFKKSSVAEIFI